MRTEQRIEVVELRAAQPGVEVAVGVVERGQLCEVGMKVETGA